MANYLERYQQGDHQAVWSELLSLGGTVRRPPLDREAYQVARETMKRVQHNIEILVARLESFGFEFGVYPDGEPVPFFRGAHVPPPADITESLNELENIVGLLPLSLRAFWETVGSVNFIARLAGGEGKDGEPEVDGLDPLVIDSIDGVLAQYEEWLEFSCEDGAADELADAFAVSLAPDVLHKDNVSGGPPYQIAIPNPSIDAFLLNEPHRTTMVEYLRICLARGGFPGAGALPIPVEELTRDLLRF